jgi:hypothetical protein
MFSLRRRPPGVRPLPRHTRRLPRPPVPSAGPKQRFRERRGIRTGIKIFAVLATVGGAMFFALNASDGPKSSGGLSGTDFGLPPEVKAPAAPATPKQDKTSAQPKQEKASVQPEQSNGRPEKAQQRPEKEQLAAAPAPAQGPVPLDQPVRPAHPDRAVPTGPLPPPPAKKERDQPTTANAEQVARGALGDLSDERMAARARLARAKTAEGQATAARSIERSYRTATRRIAAIRPASGRAEYGSLVAALTGTANAYKGLAAAIMAGDQRRYDVQRRAVVDGENATQDAADAIFG